MTDLEDHVRTSLEALPGLSDDPRIEIQHPSSISLVALVEDPLFAGKEEWERQELVWGHLRNTLTEDELNRVEFVFTNAPGESVAA